MEKSEPIDNEFEPDAEASPSDRIVQLRQFERQARTVARQAALDPDDGVELSARP